LHSCEEKGTGYTMQPTELDEAATSPATMIGRARALMESAAAGIHCTCAVLDEQFADAVTATTEALKRNGKILVTGVGKSFHIGQKIAGTLTSTGSMAIAMHPSEALHGDIGLIKSGDILLALSYSGESEEMIRLLPFAQRAGARVMAITGNGESSVARMAEWSVKVRIEQEACPFNLAPTASMLAMLALGDAFSVLLHEAAGFTREDYARNHPAGAIGHTLRLRAVDIMRPPERVPTVRPEALVKEAVLAMTRCRAGAVAVVGEDNKVVGVVTDGDLRRQLSENFNLGEVIVADVMTRNPITLPNTATAIDVMKIFEEKRIDDLMVLDERGGLAGMIDIQDMPKLKIF